MNELAIRFPKVFVRLTDKDNNEMLGIRNDATLKDLFDVYSEIVHYIDGEVIIILENLIRKKILEITKKNNKWIRRKTPSLPRGIISH